MTVFPIVEALDQRNLINYKLVRDATLFVDGCHVKDLDKLNRDLNKVQFTVNVIIFYLKISKVNKDRLITVRQKRLNLGFM